MTRPTTLPVMTDGFEVESGLKQGDGLTSGLFGIALEYLIRQLSVQDKSTIFYRSLQLIGCADTINIIERMKKSCF